MQEDSSPSNDRRRTVAEQLKHVSAPVWFLGVLSVVVSSIVIWVLVGIANNASKGYSLAVKAADKQEIFATTLTELKVDINEQKASSAALSTQIMLLDRDSKTAADTLSRQSKILNDLSDLTYRVKTLESRVHPEPWIVERLREQGVELDDLRKRLDEINREINAWRKGRSQAVE